MFILFELLKQFIESKIIYSPIIGKTINKYSFCDNLLFGNKQTIPKMIIVYKIYFIIVLFKFIIEFIIFNIYL
jgi:hypothetical protein